MSNKLFGNFNLGDDVMDNSGGNFFGLVGKITKIQPPTTVAPRLYVVKPTNIDMLQNIDTIGAVLGNPNRITTSVIAEFFREVSMAYTDEELMLVSESRVNGQEKAIRKEEHKPDNNQANIATSFDEFFKMPQTYKTQAPKSKMLYVPVGDVVPASDVVKEPKIKITNSEMDEKIEMVQYITRVTLKDGTVGESIYNPVCDCDNHPEFNLDTGKKIAYIRAKGKCLSPEKQAIKEHIKNLQSKLTELNNYDKLAKETIDNMTT